MATSGRLMDNINFTKELQVLLLVTMVILLNGVDGCVKGKPYRRLAKMVLSATLTQAPGKRAQLDLHHALFLTTGKRRYKLPE